MTAPAEAPPAAVAEPAPASRILGLDLARALAMAGMVIVHYVWPDDSGGVADVVASAMLGRAMPLFMVLGGIGVTLASRRAAHPDRSLLVRAVMLFVFGLIVHALSEWVAVVLQSYGLFFALGPVLRRLPDRALLVTSAVVGTAGAWTYQAMGGWPRNPIPFDRLDDPVYVLRALLVDGYYPFFAVGAFFILGLWLGRLDLRSDAVAAKLLVVGVVVGVAVLVVANLWVDAAGLDPADFEAARRTPNPDGFDPTRFSWSQLLYTRGHSQMPAWLLSAAGTSVAAIGASLLAATRARPAVSPLLSLGRLSLTFYVFQVVLTKVVASPGTTPIGREVLTAAAIYVGFATFAHLWTRWFRVGPLEAVLRLGSPRSPTAYDVGTRSP